MSRIAAISIYVTDLDKAARFYEDALGFVVDERQAGMLVQLKHDGPALVLCLAETTRAREYPGGVVLGIATKDLARDLERVKKAGARLIHEKPEPFPAGEFVAFHDPFGNALELLHFK